MRTIFLLQITPQERTIKLNYIETKWTKKTLSRSYTCHLKHLFFLLFFAPFGLFAQFNDFQIWTSINLNYSLNKKNNFNIEQSFRTMQNVNNWSTTFSELSYYHKINKNFYVGGAYRCSFKNRLDYYLTAHRLYISLKAKKKINDFSLNYRCILQTEYLGVQQRHDWIVPKMYNRHQFKLRYKLSKKIRPYIAYELYLALEEPFVQFGKYRLTGGTTYNFNKKNSIHIFYRYQKVNFLETFNTYILGISYKYNL